MKIRGNTVGTTLKPENAILKASGLTEAQKAQARENIGVNDYYSTKREALAVTLGIEGATASNVTSTSIWGLYDALMAAYPDKVQKKEVYSNDGSFTNFEYVVSTGDYNEVKGAFNAIDNNVKKPKYLVVSGMHGYEKPAVISTYRLFRDIVTGHNIPAHFKEGCVIHFLPVAVPDGLDSNDGSGSRYNANGVDINRNFDWNHGVNVADGKNPGDYAASENETQAIANWLNANKDAELLLDCHNMSPARNEIVTFVGLTDSEEYNQWKKIAMRGIDRVVPYWKDVIGYSNDTIFRNSASLNEGGLAVFYASEVLNIPSLGLEMSVFPTGNETARDEMGAETIAVAAEVIGNTLLEFYEQYEVVDMTEVNEKLDNIFDQVNRGFRVESGVYTVDVKDAEGIYKLSENGGIPTAVQLTIPCSSGCKLFVLEADETTRNAILEQYDSTDASLIPWMLGFTAQSVITFLNNSKTAFKQRAYLNLMKQNSTSPPKWKPLDQGVPFDNTNGFTFTCVGAKNGNYNWTAYYWND